MRVAGHVRHWKVGVSTWIASLNFVMGKALAVMFIEAAAISWWVAAMQGQTLSQLYFRWEVAQSMFSIFSRRKLCGWVGAASIAFTAFAGLEPLLQQATSSTTVLSTYHSNMAATLASALPAGFSGVVGATDYTAVSTISYTPIFTMILQGYTRQSTKFLELEGCPLDSSASCATILNGVGFQYTCSATRSGLQLPTPDPDPEPDTEGNTIFSVSFESLNWTITLTASWRERAGWTGPVVTTQSCTLVPALVEYPVNVTQQIAILESPTSSVNWTANSTHTDRTLLRVDKVLQRLPEPDYDKIQDKSQAHENVNNYSLPGTRSTLGGLSLAFQNLFGSSISVTMNSMSEGYNTVMEGSFAAPYSPSSSQNNSIDSAIPSPMDELLADIRDIMFRSSIAIAQNRTKGYSILQDGLEVQDSAVPSEKVNSMGQYTIYETVYQTNKLILSIAVGLIIVALSLIMPLYWGFWRLGRKVSMSPLEVAKAMHYSTIIDPQTGRMEDYSILEIKDRSNRLPQSGSNFSNDELIELLGDSNVKFGEVAPTILGIGLSEYTQAPTKNRQYR